MALVMAPQRSSAWCGGYLKLGANTVIDLKSEFASSSDDATYVQDGKTRTIPVGLNLDQGNYDIAFLLACRPPGGKFSRSDSWEQTSFDIQIRGPNEEVPRSLEAREIFHFVKGGSEVKGAPSGSSSKRTGSEPPTMTDNTVEPSV